MTLRQLTRRKLLKLAGLGAGTIFCNGIGGLPLIGGSTSPKTTPNEKRPNVVLITVDDMNDWVGYLGGYAGKIKTPNMDRLASQGLAFTNAHVSATVCCPSRNALFLGKRPSTTGLYTNTQWWKPSFPEAMTMPQYFKHHGYYTAGAGKVFHHTPGHNPPVSWHEYQEQVFDDPWNFATWSPQKYWLDYGYRGPIMPFPDWKPLNKLSRNKDAELDWGPIPEKQENDYGDVHVSNFARDFISRKHDTPFFLALGIYRPHLPWHVPQHYFDLYPIDDIVLPEVPEDDLNDVPAASRRLRNPAAFSDIKASNQWKEAVQAYLASITFTDARVGQILEAVENSRYAENTIIVLWSDHGFHLGSKHTWYKRTLWEESTRVPFVIHVPGKTRPNSVCHESIDTINLFPTLLSLCQLPPNPGLDGRDMTPLLLDPDSQWDFPAITEGERGDAAVRSRHWRYIRYNDGSEELYDHRIDPNEWKNLANDSRYADVIARHRAWLPASFAEPAADRTHYYFDPGACTWLHRETGAFIAGHR